MEGGGGGRGCWKAQDSGGIRLFGAGRPQGLGWCGGKAAKIPLRVWGWSRVEELWAGGKNRAGLSRVVHREFWSFAVHGALEGVDDALERQSPDALLEALLDPALALRGVRRDFADWYLEQLSSDREQKAQVRPHYMPASSLDITSVTCWYSGSANYMCK